MWVGFFKKIKFREFVDLFFLGRDRINIFRALPVYGLVPVLGKFCFFLRRRQNFEKNSPKKGFLGTFWKSLTKKSRFSERAPPSKLVYFGAQGAFRKILGSVGQKWIS